MDNVKASREYEVKIAILPVKIPVFDLQVNNPFSIKIKDLRVEIPVSVVVETKLPPIFKLETPTIEVKELAYIVSPEDIENWRSSFEDLATSVPVIREPLLTILDHTKELLDKEIRSRKLKEIKIEPKRIEIKIERPMRKDLPGEIHDRYSIKIRIRRELTPEIREILESRLTKEFKITRMIKKMEIIRDERTLTELEILLRDIV
ncbi:MAG: hypothetical protein B6U89_04905, partial [Desulfurococcales archaeon ex4484_58]